MTVVIADDDINNIELFLKIIKIDANFEVIGTANDGIEALRIIRVMNPDIAILDLIMPKLDGIGVLEEIANDNTLSNIPYFIVISVVKRNWIIDKIHEFGAACYIKKPINEDALLKHLNCIRTLMNDQCIESLENYITDLLHSIQIPINLKGFIYLRKAIFKCFQDIEMLNLITKTLYPYIAKKYSTTPSKIERAIRYSIEIAWQNKNINLINIFGCSVYKRRPTNSKFIKKIVNYMFIDLNEKSDKRLHTNDKKF